MSNVDILVDKWAKTFIGGYMTREVCQDFLNEMEALGVEYKDYVKRLDERHKEFY